MMTLNMPSAGKMPRSFMQYAPPVPVEPRADDFDLTAGLRLIRRRIVMIAMLSLVLIAAAMPLILGLKPVYHAESRLMIHPPMAATLDPDAPGRGDALDLASEIERLRSKSIAEQVIRELKLDEREEFNPALRRPSLIERLRKMLRNPGGSPKAAPAGQDRMEGIIQAYYRALSVQRDGTTAVIRIGFDSRDPRLAAAVPNKLIGIYLKQRQDSLRSRLASTLAWVTQRIDEQRGRVASARDAADRYGKETGLASESLDEQGKAVADLSARLTALAQNRAETSATISALAVAAKNPTALANVVLPDSIGTIERNLRRQQLDLDRLLKTYGDNAQEVVAQRARILRTQSDLGIERDRYVQSQHARLLVMNRQEAALRDELTQARRKLSAAVLEQAELARLQQAAGKEQAALDKLEGQRRALTVEAALPGAEAEILSPAAVPLLPQGRGRLFYLIAAMLAAVCLAVTAAFLREMMDNSVRSYDQLETVPAIIPAGFIPRIGRKEGRSLPVFSGHSHGGMFGEAIRTAVIALKQSNGGRFPDSVVVTSAHGGEGKSLVSRSLAIELAATGRRVLLVDGDLRRGNLSALFKPGSKQGLNEFLAGEAGLAEVVHRHPKTGLDFIPRGNPGLDRRSDLDGLAEIVDFARRNGQIVIFDSAPVLASTDTVQLAALVERAVMVVQWAAISRRAVEYGLRRLKSANHADILVAINKVKPKKHSQYGFTDSEIFSKSLKRYYEMTL